MYDIVIIGAGVSGCSIARELSRYKLNICVLERESDVGEGTSKANSAIIHAGFDAKEGSLKAKLNVWGNDLMGEMSKTLDFPFRRNGSMVTCQNKEELTELEILKERGEKNGVKGMQILNRDQALELESNLSDTVYAALLAPSSGITCPFLQTIAYAENAVSNGVDFKLNTKVENIKKIKMGYEILTNRGIFKSKYVINAAGVYADVLHNMVSEEKTKIIPRRGSYLLLDKMSGDLVNHTIFQVPTSMGKGVLVTPTIHGNLLVGPTAVDIDNREGTYTSASEIAELKRQANKSVKDIPIQQVITSFAGVRAREEHGDFIIKEVQDAKGFIDVMGIDSPGLSSAPAIGLYVRDLVLSILDFDVEEKSDFQETRQAAVVFSALSQEERNSIIKKNPAYGRVICRCETVTEGEILDAIHRPLGATTIDGVKRRTRAGMGRCQAGFCMPKVMEILMRELQIPATSIRKNEQDSTLIVGRTKEFL